MHGGPLFGLTLTPSPAPYMGRPGKWAQWLVRQDASNTQATAELTIRSENATQPL